MPERRIGHPIFTQCSRAARRHRCRDTHPDHVNVGASSPPQQSPRVARGRHGKEHHGAHASAAREAASGRSPPARPACPASSAYPLPKPPSAKKSRRALSRATRRATTSPSATMKSSCIPAEPICRAPGSSIRGMEDGGAACRERSDGARAPGMREQQPAEAAARPRRVRRGASSSVRHISN